MSNNKSFSAFFDENFHALDLYAKLIELMDFILYDQFEDYSVSGAVEERLLRFKEKYNAISERYDLDYALKMLDYDFIVDDIPDELFFIRRNKETALLLPYIYNMKGTVKAIKWFMSLYGAEDLEFVSWWDANQRYLNGDTNFTKITPPHEWRMVVKNVNRPLDADFEAGFYNFLKKFTWVNIDDVTLWFNYTFEDDVNLPTDFIEISYRDVAYNYIIGKWNISSGLPFKGVVLPPNYIIGKWNISSGLPFKQYDENNLPYTYAYEDDDVIWNGSESVEKRYTMTNAKTVSSITFKIKGGYFNAKDIAINNLAVKFVGSADTFFLVKVNPSILVNEESNLLPTETTIVFDTPKEVKDFIIIPTSSTKDNIKTPNPSKYCTGSIQIKIETSYND